MITSCVSGSTAVGHAPMRVMKRCSRSNAVPSVSGVGVRYQVASANRSARACSTPAVSAPASQERENRAHERKKND